MSKEIKIDENSYLMLLNRVLKNKEEERDMALDRYRKADESIQSTDHFMLLGKNAVSYLRLASDTTNDLASLAKEIKSIVFKESDNSNGSFSSQSADEMRLLIDMAKESDEEKKSESSDDFEDKK